jgi:hypothetical protein
MVDISVLVPFVDEEPEGFSELVTSCGRFIDAWLAAGGEPTDDPVVGFYSLWAQSLDLSRERHAQAAENDFYEWAYPSFIRYRDEVRDKVRGGSAKS